MTDVTISIHGHASSVSSLIRSLDTVSKETAMALIEICIETGLIFEYGDSVLSVARSKCKEGKLFLPATVGVKA